MYNNKYLYVFIILWIVLALFLYFYNSNIKEMFAGDEIYDAYLASIGEIVDDEEAYL